MPDVPKIVKAEKEKKDALANIDINNIAGMSLYFIMFICRFVNQ